MDAPTAGAPEAILAGAVSLRLGGTTTDIHEAAEVLKPLAGQRTVVLDCGYVNRIAPSGGTLKCDANRGTSAVSDLEYRFDDQLGVYLFDKVHSARQNRLREETSSVLTVTFSPQYLQEQKVFLSLPIKRLERHQLGAAELRRLAPMFPETVRRGRRGAASGADQGGCEQSPLR